MLVGGIITGFVRAGTAHGCQRDKVSSATTDAGLPGIAVTEDGRLCYLPERCTSEVTTSRDEDNMACPRRRRSKFPSTRAWRWNCYGATVLRKHDRQITQRRGEHRRIYLSSQSTVLYWKMMNRLKNCAHRCAWRELPEWFSVTASSYQFHRRITFNVRDSVACMVAKNDTRAMESFNFRGKRIRGPQ